MNAIDLLRSERESTLVAIEDEKRRLENLRILVSSSEARLVDLRDLIASIDGLFEDVGVPKDADA